MSISRRRVALAAELAKSVFLVSVAVVRHLCALIFIRLVYQFWLQTFHMKYQGVEAANKLYAFVADCISFLRSRSVAWSIENPANSLLWKITSFIDIARQTDVSRVEFQQCAYGVE